MQIDSDEQPMMMHGNGHGHGRVHPASSSSDFSGEMNQSAVSDPSSSPLYSFHFEKPVPPPPPQQQPAGTYVVQVPKDKVFRVPPPENARLFDHYTRRARRRRRGSCSCACLLVGAAVALAAALAGVLACLVLGPKPPAYAVQALAVSGLVNASASASSSPAALSPGFDATVRADNRNGRLGVRYEGGRGRVSVSYGGALLADGAWPALYQAPRNVTVVVARARGSGVRLSRSVRGQLAAAERLRSVPFDMDVDVPVRLQLGVVRTWAVPLRARCTVAVDRLAADARVVSNSCDVKVRLLSWWRN
jgi:hypothetical protein|uniref:NHL25 n=1 Tax=Zea mays TaxID=4577 RepID=B6SML6_MAIZE|nr:NHL25 [Zea mays]